MSARGVLSAILITGVIGTATLFAWHEYQSYQRSEQCLQDTVEAIHELYQVRGDRTDRRPFEDAYYFQQHVIDARRLLSPWIADSQPDRRQIAHAAQDAVNEFERAAELFMQINRGYGDEEKLAELKVKVDSGRSRLMNLAVTVREHRPPLTEASKHRLIRYIDIVFTKKLLDENAAPKDDPNAPFAPEVFAAAVIKRDLEH